MRTPLERVERVLAAVTVESPLGMWAWGFLETLRKRAPETLTERAEEELSKLEQRILGEEAKV